MAIINETVTLKSGTPMPKLAFGTYALGKANVETVILEAISLGYRHFETAPIYLNEQGIGDAIRKSGIDRDAFFITSKVPPHIKTHDGTLRVVRRTMEKLGVEHLDLLLINNPVPWGEEGKDYAKENQDVWSAMEALYEEESVGAIGVSNFNEEDIEALKRTATIIPHVNQVAIFAGHTLDTLRAYCKQEGIVVQGHSPLARGRLLKTDWIQALAEKEDRSPANLALRFVYELGVMPVVKASRTSHMEDNLKLDKALHPSTFKTMKALKDDVRDYKPPKAKSIL
ncbi:MAG: aldo/keto reductase family protein [Candidatus Izemoplasmataceae bacterium]